MTQLLRIAVLSATLASTNAHAQVTDAFIGSKGNFLKSTLCTRLATCTSAGTIRLTALSGTPPLTEDYYTVKPKQKQAYGLPAYTVFFTRRTDGTVERAGLRYPPAQDYVEDGSFAIEFFSFVAGVPLHAVEGYALMSECGLNIRGKTKYLYINGQAHLSMGGAGEQVILMTENFYGKLTFAQQSTSTRVIRSRC